jgi:hypothetical protein
MRFRLLPILCLFSAALFAGQTINSSQLVDFVRSSLAMKYEDAKIAKYVKGVTLTDKLDRKTIESLEAQGAGPKTVKVLQDLCDQTANMKSSNPPANGPSGTAPASGLSSSMTSKIPQPAPPDSVEQKKILDEMGNYANTYAQNLPNFLCVQVTKRYVSFDGGENYRFEDKIMTKLSYNEGHENYKVYLVNNQLVDTDLEKLGGAISSGEFGSLMQSLFAKKSQAEFGWDHWARLGPDVVAVFNYFIDSGHSDYTLDYDRGAQRIVTAYKGLIYADQYTGAIRRITFEAVDIPADFPIREAKTILDYGDQRIGDNPYMLPLRAFVRMAGPKNVHTKNDETFTLYQKFGSESNIQFSKDELKPDTNSKPVEPTEDPVMKGLPPPPPK